MGETDDFIISTDSGTSTGSSTTTIHSGGTFTTTASTGGDLIYMDDHGNVVNADGINMVGPDFLEEEEVISEEVQEKIDKIGTPGKRNIDDLLSSFKVVADSKKGAPLEELDDSSWIDDVLAKDLKRYHEDVRPESES